MSDLPKTATSGAYRGYNSSKRRYFYGLKVHMVTTAEGNPVEVSLMPGSYNDTGHLRTFELDLPEGSMLYGDKASDEYFTEDILAEACGVELIPHLKKLEATGRSLRRIRATDLLEENRNGIQRPEAAAPRIDSRDLKPRL